jgi:hypothetical protein
MYHSLGIEKDRGKNLEVEFRREQSIRRILTRLSIVLGLGSGIVFLVLLFQGGYLADTRIAILMYWGMFTNISSILLIPYYSIPRLILDLTHLSEQEREIRMEILRKSPESYLYPFLRARGIREPWEPESIHFENLKEAFGLTERQDWKKIGKYYLGFYLLVSSICMYFFLQAEF